jgi:hypothetical protein
MTSHPKNQLHPTTQFATLPSMRKSLQITLLILSLIPLFFGLTGVIFGTGRFLAEGNVVPQLDSQFRYLSGIYLLVSFLIW